MNRYSGSVESTSARDYLDLKAWFDDDVWEPPLIREFRDRFRSIDLRREMRRGTSVYNGVFNLLVINGARDWANGTLPIGEDLDDHHIVPKSWADGKALSTSIDSILNRTPLTSDTNRTVLSDRLPCDYLPELIATNGEATIRAIFASHLISATAFDILLRTPFTSADYEAFIAERQRTIQDAIEDLLIKARIDLSPRLRELDIQIESVELRLRQLIATALNNEPMALPPHVQQKIQERLQLAAKKNPALNLRAYDRLLTQLEYADLRELQDALVSKTSWAAFEPYFRNKEMLAIRFTQLAELRNSIRHSRRVDEVTRKDGEAALLWFDGVLGNSGG